MNAQPKKMNRARMGRALVMLGVLALGTGATIAGDRDADTRWKTTPDDRAQRAALMTSSGNSSAVLFAPGVRTVGSFYTYERDVAPEYDRRDSQLSLSTPDATAGWYAWPSPPRPSLNDRDYFTSSSNPSTFVFPGIDGYSSYDRHRREIRRDRIRENQKHIHIHTRGSRGSDGPRRRVR
jgi:hypothetical protein